MSILRSLKDMGVAGLVRGAFATVGTEGVLSGVTVDFFDLLPLLRVFFTLGLTSGTFSSEGLCLINCRSRLSLADEAAEICDVVLALANSDRGMPDGGDFGRFIKT